MTGTPVRNQSAMQFVLERICARPGVMNWYQLGRLLGGQDFQPVPAVGEIIRELLNQELICEQTKSGQPLPVYFPTQRGQTSITSGVSFDEVSREVHRLDDFQQYVDNFGIGVQQGRDNSQQRQQKRGMTWMPRRCCHDDWLLSAFVARHTRTRYDVALFLCEDLYTLERFSGVKAGLMFILSDAYHQTGRMEIHFVGPQRGQQATIHTGHEPDIPESIKEFGRELGIPIEGQVTEGHGRDRNSRLTKLDDKTGRALYAKITGFSERAVKALSREDSQLDLTRACFIVQRGVWSVEQVEYIAQEAYDPPRLLEGGITPESRLSFQHDLLTLRTALAWQRAKTILEALSSKEPVTVTYPRWTRDVAEFTPDKDIEVDCVGGKVSVKAGETVRVLLLPRQREGYQMFKASDQQAARSVQARIVVVTKDFHGEEAAGFKAAGLDVLMLHDTLADLDQEAYRRLARSVSTQRKMPEHAE